MNNLKLNPYDKLRSILNEGELTQRGSDNLDEILGLKPKQSQKNLVEIIISIFNKIDSWIFRKPSKIGNTYYKRK